MPFNANNSHFLCNIHPLTDVLSGQSTLPDSIAEHNELSPLSRDAIHDSAIRGEYIACTNYDCGTFTESTCDDLTTALIIINDDSDPRAYVYTISIAPNGAYLFITYNKP